MAVNLAPTFKTGNGTNDTSIISTYLDSSAGHVIQADGKIILAGRSGGYSFASDFGLVRFNTNGTLDVSFGTQGLLTTDFGTYDATHYVIQQADGKFVIIGDAKVLDYPFTPQVVVIRYNSNGTLDTSFDADGKLAVFNGQGATGGVGAIQADGKLLIAGQADISGFVFYLQRLNSDGTADITFGNSGNGFFGGLGKPSAVKVQADGKIVLLTNNTNDFTLSRYNTDGSVDTSFHSTGSITSHISADLLGGLGIPDDKATALTFQADGKIIVVGYSVVSGNDSSTDITVSRYNSDGGLDLSFNSNGTAVIPVSTSTVYNTSFDFASSITIQDDGKILISGGSEVALGEYDFTLIRLNQNGSLDTTFSGDGKVTTHLFRVGSASAVTVQTDGKILVSGQDNGRLALLRYNADGSPDIHFNATTDSLNNSPSYIENATSIVLDSSVNIFDLELAALNSNLGNYGGASVTLVRQGGANAQDIFSGSGNLTFSGSNVVLSGVTIGTVTNATGTLIITFNNNATQARVDQVLSSIAYSNTSEAPPTSVQINWSFNDGNTGIQGTGGAQASVGSTTVIISAVNDAPTFNGSINNSPAYIENAISLTLDNSVTIFDAELAASGNYSGSSLTLARQGGANAQDNFSSNGNLSFSGGNALISGINIGTVNNTNGTLFLTFNANATQARVNEAISAITYSNNSDAPPASVQISWTFNDGNTSIQGSGGVQNALGTTVVNITAVNDAPEVDIPISDQSNQVGVAYSYVLPANTFTDDNTPSLTYTATLSNGSGLPSWLTFNATTKTFSGTPTQTGNLSIRITATDSSSATAFDDFNLSISTNPNNPPGGSGNLPGVTLSYQQTANMVNPLVWQAVNTTFVSPTQINLTDNAGFSAVFYGSFSYGSGYLDGGTVTGYDFYRNGAIEYTVRSANLDAISVNNYLAVRDTLGLQQYTFNNNDTVNGTSGNDSLTGGAGSDTLNGGAGNDTLNGGAGNDTMNGGLGNDIYVVSEVGDVVTEGLNQGYDGVYASISNTLADNVELLVLTGSANNQGTGNGLNNILIGNTGSNMLNGGAGNDTMQGGLGNDVYVVTEVGDVVTEALNAGYDSVYTNINHTLAANLESVVLFGNANINATGNGLNNILTGNAGNNTLNGGAGNDTMIGGLGNDIYVVSEVGDVVTEGLNQGYDGVYASISNTLADNVELLVLTGSANNQGTGNGLNNILIGNTGSNMLNGGAGNDTMQGGLGNDVYVVTEVGDVVTEALNAGYDSVYTNINHTLAANLESVVLFGNANINATGNGLNNILTGNAGNNTLNGGAGNDTMIGGLGRDLFVFDNVLNASTNRDTIQGFNVLEDEIQLDFTIFDAIGMTLDAVEFRSGAGVTTASTTDQHIIFNTSTGTLYYDADGLGGVAATQFATLTGTVGDLSNHNFSFGLNFNITGTTQADTLNGTIENDAIVGLAGNDILNGGIGTDILYGDLGDDTFLCR